MLLELFGLLLLKMIDISVDATRRKKMEKIDYELRKIRNENKENV